MEFFYTSFRLLNGRTKSGLLSYSNFEWSNWLIDWVWSGMIDCKGCSVRGDKVLSGEG